MTKYMDIDNLELIEQFPNVKADYVIQNITFSVINTIQHSCSGQKYFVFKYNLFATSGQDFFISIALCVIWILCVILLRFSSLS